MRKTIVFIMMSTFLLVFCVSVAYADSSAPIAMSYSSYRSNNQASLLGSLIGIALLSLIPGFIAKHKGRSFAGYYFLSFLITPLIATIVTVCLSNLNKTSSKTAINDPAAYSKMLEKTIGRKKLKQMSVDEIKNEKLYLGQLVDKEVLGLKDASPIVIPSTMSFEDYLEGIKTQNGESISWASEGCRVVENVYSVENVLVDKFQVNAPDVGSRPFYICKADFKEHITVFAPEGYVYSKPSLEEKPLIFEEDSCTAPENKTLHLTEPPIAQATDQFTTMQAASTVSAQETEEYNRALGLLSIPSHENIDSAIAIMTELAEKSNYSPAAKWLGEYYESVVADYQKAVEWYKKAAQIEE